MAKEMTLDLIGVQLKTLIEGQRTLERRLDGMDAKIEAMDAKIDGLADDLDGNTMLIRGLAAYLGSQDSRLKAVEKEIERLGAA